MYNGWLQDNILLRDRRMEMGKYYYCEIYCTTLTLLSESMSTNLPLQHARLPMPQDYIYIFEDDELGASDPMWDKSKWIGCGREYRNVPENIAKIGQNILAIPSLFRSLLLSKDLSILELIAHAPTLPIQDEVTPVPSMHLDWSDEEPEELDVNDLASIIMPSLKAITRLNDTFGQAWFDGKQSLKDMRTGGETRRYPLWVNTYFHNMRQACRISDKWCAASDWLHKTPLIDEELSVKDTAYAYLGTLKCWDGEIHGLCNDLKLEFMADILGDHPLPGGVVDAMSNLLSLRLQCQKPTSHFLITDTRFPDLIEAEVWKNNDELGAAEYLEKYSTWIRHKHCDKLIFVFHVPPFHWATCMIDIKQKTIRYGDSLQLPHHRPLFKSLKSWLKEKVSDTDFTVTSDLACAWQSNSFNCPLISVNTIAHTVFGDPLWSHRTSRLKRFEAFCNIMAYPIGQADKVSLVSSSCLLHISGAYDDGCSFAKISMIASLLHGLQQIKQCPCHCYRSILKR